MRCLACNAELNDSESVNMGDHGDFIDLCYVCIGKTAAAMQREDCNDNTRVTVRADAKEAL